MRDKSSIGVATPVLKTKTDPVEIATYIVHALNCIPKDHTNIYVSKSEIVAYFKSGGFEVECSL